MYTALLHSCSTSTSEYFGLIDRKSLFLKQDIKRYFSNILGKYLRISGKIFRRFCVIFVPNYSIITHASYPNDPTNQIAERKCSVFPKPLEWAIPSVLFNLLQITFCIALFPLLVQHGGFSDPKTTGRVERGANRR